MILDSGLLFWATMYINLCFNYFNLCSRRPTSHNVSCFAVLLYARNKIHTKRTSKFDCCQHHWITRSVTQLKANGFRDLKKDHVPHIRHRIATGTYMTVNYSFGALNRFRREHYMTNALSKRCHAATRILYTAIDRGLTNRPNLRRSKRKRRTVDRPRPKTERPLTE